MIIIMQQRPRIVAFYTPPVKSTFGIVATHVSCAITLLEHLPVAAENDISILHGAAFRFPGDERC